MEVAGLVVGIASLFSVCLDVIDIVETYKSFDASSRHYFARFEASKLKLREWADAVGVVDGQLSENHHERLDIPEVASVVRTILFSICEIFEKSEDIRKRLRLSTGLAKSHLMPWPGSLGSQDEADNRKTMPYSSKRRGIEWTIRGKVRFADQVGMMEASVNGLYELVTPAGDEARLSNNITTRMNSMSIKEAAYAQKILRISMEEIRNKVVQQVYLTVDKWLDIRKIDGQYERYLQDRLEGTCDWIFNEPAYCEWMSMSFPEDAAKFLWIHGPAGHGKSIICARLYEKLQDDSASPCAYWSSTNHVQAGGQPDSAIRHWLSQMSKTNEIALDIIRDSIQSGKIGQSASDFEVWGVFKKVVTSVDHCTLIIDGLDEYGPSEGRRKNFLRKLKISVEGTRTRCLVVSREENDIEVELKQAAYEHGKHTMYEYRITKTVLQADIELYSNHVVQMQLPRKEESFRHQLAADMADKCEGMFLMIKLHQDKLRAGKSQKALQNIVKSWPSGLNQSYDRNWANIENLSEDDRHRAVSILRWTIYALRPLTVAELTEALIVESDIENTDFPLDDLPDDIDDEYIDSEIKSLCCSLIEIRSDNPDTLPKARTVHVIHPSVKEYLISALPVPLISELPLVTQPQQELQHGYLAMTCLRYLNFAKIWDPRQHWEEANSSYAFIEYSAFFWHQHVEEARHLHSQVSSYITKFFTLGNEQFIAWTKIYGRAESEYRQFTDATFMYYAALFGLNSVMQYIQSQGISDIDALAGPLGAALEPACATNRTEAAKLLIEWGASINVDGGRFGAALNTAVRYGSRDMVTFLIDSGANIAKTDPDGQTALHFACTNNDASILSSLLRAGIAPNVQTNDGATALLFAVKNRKLDLIKILLNQSADASIADNEGQAPLHLAAASGQLEVVKLLLDNGGDVSIRDNGGLTPLHYAAERGQLESIKLLLDAGVDPSVLSTNKDTALHLAAWKGHLACVRLLLDAGIDPSVSDDYGTTPLHYAAEDGHLECVKLLLDAGAETSVLDERRATPLHDTALKGHFECIRLLLNAGVDPEVLDENGSTALHYAAWKGHLKCVRLLLDTGVDPSVLNKRRATPLRYAALEGHLECVRLLLNTGVDPSVLDEDGRTPLLYAAWKGHLECVRLLLGVDVDPSVSDNYGTTPLHYTAEDGHLDCAKLLIDAGADPSVVDARGATPLHYMVLEGHLECVRLLLDAGINPLVLDEDGRTPLLYAAWKGHLECVRLLLGVGADPSVSDNYGTTPLHYTVENNHLDCAKLLLDAGVDPSVSDENGSTALHYVALEGHLECVRLLLGTGINPLVLDDNGRTPLLCAAWKGHLECVRLLLGAGADPSVSDNYGTTPLHYTVENNHLDCAKLLLDAGVDPSVSDKNGSTALHYVALEGHLECVRLLLDAGADISALNDCRFTPLHHAADKGHLAIIELFMTYRAQANKENIFGESVLRSAILGGHEDCIEFLLERNADLSSTDIYGRSCLRWLRILSPNVGKFQRWIAKCSEDIGEEKTTAHLLRMLRIISYGLLEGEKAGVQFDYWRIGRCLLFLGMLKDARFAFQQLCEKTSEGKLAHWITCDFCCESDPSCTLRVCKTCPNIHMCENCSQKGPAEREHRACCNHDFFEVPIPLSECLPTEDVVQGKLKYWSELEMANIGRE